MSTPNALEVVILALAVWRISSLFTYERGPFHVFEWVRSLVNIRHADTGKITVIPETFWGELLTCVWCFSLYVALLLSVLYYLYGSIIVWVCLPLALSALAIIANRFTR